MKHSVLFTCLAGTAMLLSSCGGGDKVEVEGIPVQLTKGGMWAIMEPDGDIIVEDAFASEKCPTFVINDMFSVESKSGEYALYNIDDVKNEVASGFTGIGSFTFEDVAPAVKKDKPISIIDKKGEEVANLGENVTSAHPYFQSGLLVITKNVDNKSKMGAVDTEGQEAIAAKYDGLSDFVGGVASAVVYSDNGDATWYVVNKDGEEVKVNKASNISEFKDGVALMTVNGKDGGKTEYFFIDKNGEEKFKVNDCDGVLDWNSDYYVFKEGSSKGIKSLNEDQEKLISAKYSTIGILENGNLLVKEGETYTIVNKKGDKVADKFDYKFAIPTDDGDHFIVNEGDNYILVDDNGEPVDKKQTIYGVGGGMQSGSLNYYKKN